MKRTLTLATTLALAAAACMPLASSAQNFSIVIGDAPPAPRFESVPAARPGYVWAPGYWNWDGNRHDWVDGHWERERQGYRYRAAEWRRDDGGYRLNPGGWTVVSNGDVNYVRVAPPAPRYERAPRARPGYVWEPGHWEWRRGRYQWMSGKWIAVRRGYEYRPHMWVERDGHWYLEQPRWSRPGRDRDRDGINDRYDRDLDNDGIPNRHDADRDGDGVRNERDARPNNDRRY